jgi:hypothetical protein
MVDDGVRYELKTVKAMRGTEGRSTAKWQKEGWELVDQSTGTLHTTLNFRRPKPPLPMRHIVIGGAVALILAGIIGVGALLEGKGDGKDSPSTSPATVATEQSDSPSTPVATEQPDSPPTQITDITVDELLDKLNSASMGGIKNGDRFRITAELFESDAWGTGASGEFTVYLKAKGGAGDLMVFVDESDAAGWQDGTRVTMVVESGETTINGETTDGWLRAQSVTTVPGR